jgi:hypothetical protein
MADHAHSNDAPPTGEHHPGGEPNFAAVTKVALGALVLGAVVFGACAAISAREEGFLRDVLLAYQAGFVFWMGLPLGALSLTLLGYLTSASWGKVQRRIFQALMKTWPVIFVLSLPILGSLWFPRMEVPASSVSKDEICSTASPFWWSIPTDQYTDVPEAIAEFQHKKHDWLNPTAFTIRTVIYFAIFGLLMFVVNGKARKYEETGDAKHYSFLRGIAGPGVLLWALLTTLLVTDWVMSVEPTWSSTMFPVIFAVNGFLCAHCFGVFTFYSLNMNNREVMDVYLKDKFRLDMGSLMLGFAMVWSYASFSQFMLIWAGNLPEEVTYYLKRGIKPNGHVGGWTIMAYLLVVLHWLVPFVVLLFKEVKLHPNRMRFMCCLLLGICMIDVVWWIAPAVADPGTGRERTYVVPMAFGAIAMVGGIVGLAFGTILKSRSMISPEMSFLKEWGHH